MDHITCGRHVTSAQHKQVVVFALLTCLITLIVLSSQYTYSNLSDRPASLPGLNLSGSPDGSENSDEENEGITPGLYFESAFSLYPFLSHD